jgi:hypothetical protein
MPTDKAKELKELLKNNIYDITAEGGSGEIVRLPKFELHPRDFLLYAEDELNDLNSNKSIINCVSNLKRAIDCQLDFFLYALNLQKYFRDKRLGVDKKLGFIEKCGLFSKTSLSRINNIRNKLEHQYKLPKLEDIRVYYDLIHALITVLENSISIAGTYSELEFNVVDWEEENDGEPKSIGSLTSQYLVKTPEVIIKFSKNDLSKVFVAGTENFDEMAFFVKTHDLLSKLSSTFHGEFASIQVERL